MLSEFLGKVWENGEFGIALARSFEYQPSAKALKTEEQKEHEQLIADLLKVHGAEVVLQHYGFDPFGLSPLSNSHSPVQRGLKGITGYGKRLVRNACARMERENPKDTLTFATFTLPNVSLEESVSCGRNWAEICRVFNQKLRRRLQGFKLPGEIVSVTEIQEKRSFKHGVLGLHVHMVFVGRKRKRDWVMSPIEYRELWASVLSTYLPGNPETYDWRAVEHIVRVEKSLEGYLGKYATKGVQSLQKIIAEFGEEGIPSAWFSCSQSLKCRVVRRVKTVKDERALSIINECLNSDSNAFVYRFPIVLSEGGVRPVTVGWFGKIRDEYINSMLGIT